MHLIVFALALYAVIAEWRNYNLRTQLIKKSQVIQKYVHDNTYWYANVLPQADKLCLIETKKGEFLVSKLSDKRWQKEDGEVDFSAIKRWMYIEDLEKL